MSEMTVLKEWLKSKYVKHERDFQEFTKVS